MHENNTSMKKLLMILLVILSACKASETAQEKAPVIFMKKTPCFGTCPDYDIAIYENGMAHINARRYLKIEGTYEAQLSEQQLHSLLELFAQSNFQSFEKSYTSNVTDLPTTFLTYRSGDKEKTVEDYYGAPDKLKTLEKAVEDLVDQLDWKPVK